VRIVGSRRRRSIAALLAAGAAVLLVSQSAFAAVDWGKVRQVGSAYSYNFGGALSRSTKGTTSYLHATYTTVKVGGEFITDDGPFAGVYYRRGNSSGSDWGTAKRLNPTSSHADDGMVVASGRVVYAAYVSYGHWLDYDPAEPRPITLRINSNHGASGDWLSRTIEPLETRVDRPALAPWGTRGVLMTYTDADTGNIMLVQCGDLSVEESGCSAGSVGTTTVGEASENGYAGFPVVAASGDTIAVAWFDGSGGISLVTKEGEGDWSDPAVVTASESRDLSAAAKGDRFAFSWQDSGRVRVRLWTSAGGLGTASTVATFSDTGTYKNGYSTAVALTGDATIGVAFGACRRADCTGSSSTGVDLRWRQSGNDGDSWGAASTVGSYAVSSERRMNDFASVVMTSASKRYVMFNTANPTFGKFRIVLRAGTG
jgi:hypothetical protein